MCGIVGVFGNDKANEIVLEGLRRLEYRGYDSCGIAYTTLDQKLKIVKSTERIATLKENVNEKSNISFGHTRWATHGVVNLENAHPHLTEDKKMAIVHNGVIENYLELKNKYCSTATFKSETDTEVLLYVLEYFYKQTANMVKAINKFSEIVKGSYAIILYHTDEPNQIYALKNKSPLLLGEGNGYYTLSSDPSAVSDEIKNFYQIEDKKSIKINLETKTAELFNGQGAVEELIFEKMNIQYEEITTQEYSTFMQKEIEEQPKVLRNIVENYQTLGFDQELKQEITSAKRIKIISCGTSYNAGLIGKKIIQNHLKIPTEVLIASEYGYEQKIIEDGTLFIFLSQSGETADSMLVFNQVRGKHPILAITNVRESQMDRNADYSLQLFAGVEIAVASTKAYTAQIAVLAALIYETIGDKTIYELLLKIALEQELVIKNNQPLMAITKQLKDFREVFILGRLGDYSLAQESALKIKEITYINVAAMASGELKHGTISLIDENKLIFTIITDPKIAANSRSNNQEVKARGGRILTFSTKETSLPEDEYIIDYSGPAELSSLVMVIPFQFLALYTAQKLNLDVDKPRNLAKAVTVE